VKGRFEQPEPVRKRLQVGFRALIRRSTKGMAGSKEDSVRRFLAAKLMPCMPAGSEGKSGRTQKVSFSQGSWIERFDLKGPKNPNRERRFNRQAKLLI